MAEVLALVFQLLLLLPSVPPALQKGFGFRGLLGLEFRLQVIWGLQGLGVWGLGIKARGWSVGR